MYDMGDLNSDCEQFWLSVECDTIVDKVMKLPEHVARCLFPSSNYCKKEPCSSTFCKGHSPRCQMRCQGPVSEGQSNICAQTASHIGPVKKRKEEGVCVVNDIAQAELTPREWRTYMYIHVKSQQ